MSAKKILIIDADVASRNFIARTLAEQKYEVIHAGSGKEGLIYAWRDRPIIIIADPTIPDLRGEELAAKLKQDPRTSNVPLIALSGDTSVTRIKSCLDAGFNDYIAKSGQAIAVLNESINRLLGLSQAAVKKGGLLVVFLSAKGGTGVSSLCANLAMNVSVNQPEAKVAVVDMILPIGSIAQIVGYTGDQNIVTVADKPVNEITPEFFKDNLPTLANWRFHLLAGSPDPETSNHLNVGRILDIVTAIKASYDYVFVDLGRSLSKISLPLIQHSDLLAMILSTDSSTVSLTKTLWEYLKAKGVREEAVYMILNRAVGLEGLSKLDAEKILGLTIKTAVPYLGSNFALANNQHQPFSIKFPNDTASVVFRETAKDMFALARKLRAE